MTNTNNGCACTPNQSIKCTVTNCAHHCQDQNYCGLNAITVGTHETNPTKVECTDCQSFQMKKTRSDGLRASSSAPEARRLHP